MEWTMEAFPSIDRVSRGGEYGYSGSLYPVSFRYYCDADSPYDYIGFRPALYIK